MLSKQTLYLKSRQKLQTKTQYIKCILSSLWVGCMKKQKKLREKFRVILRKWDNSVQPVQILMRHYNLLRLMNLLALQFCA